MSETTTEAPRLRLVRTTLAYLVLWPLIAGVATMIGTFFSGSPLNPGEFLTNPSEMLGFFMLVYVFGGVPAALNGLIVGLISPDPTRLWMAPGVSAIWGGVLFAATGYMSVKSFGLFAVVGAIGGAGMGLILLWKRPWFERPTVPAAAPSSGSAAEN